METGVCVIILSYFGGERVAACLRSLVGQQFDTLYLVDNSVDTSQGTHLGRLRDEFVASSSSQVAVKLLIQSENVGFARGVNAAIRLDRLSGGHSCYLLLNDDATLPPGGLAAMVARLSDRDDLALVAARVVTGELDTQVIWYQRWFGHLSFHTMPGSFAYLQGSCLLVDCRLIADNSLFDEAFFMYGEDILLSWEALRAGFAIDVAPDVVVEHQGSASSRHGGFFYEYHVARAHVLLARRLARSSWELPVMYLGRVVYLAARAFLRSVRFRSLVPLFAALAAWFPVRIRPGRPNGQPPAT